ncbi:leucyl aminopeptidase [Candidatus Woesearchaeota archaeon]|nr:leucyl aminopeptidase [Candidatus Woesearchaeota archaeon]
MKIIVKKGDVLSYDGDAIIIPVFEQKSGVLDALDKACNNALVQGWKAESGKLLCTKTLGVITPKHVVIVGLGARDKADSSLVKNMIAKAAQQCRSLDVKRVGVYVEPGVEYLNATAVVLGLELGLYEYGMYKTDKSKIKRIEEIALYAKVGDKDIKEARCIARATNFVKDLVNTPPLQKTTMVMEQWARSLTASGVDVQVWNKKELEKHKMGGILAVSRGASDPPKLLILKYLKGKGKPTVLVGKGITFDTGGLNIKTGPHMKTMKMDMAGAATVLGALKAISELGLRVNIIGLVPTCENAVSKDSYHPDDIVTTYSGKTVEIVNTDAEGRIILADALSYACQCKPKQIIDFATLTGAMLVALGHEAAGVFAKKKDRSLVDALVDAAEISTDRVWPMPLYDEYIEAMKGDISDLKNLADARWAGSATAAGFLSNFVEENAWAHLDIAGTAYFDKSVGYRQKGATGFGVHLMVEFFKNMQ